MRTAWLAAVFCAAVPGQADDTRSRVRPFLERHCFDCHGEDVQKGKLRLDTLSASFSSSDAWEKVLKKLSAGEMPPKKKPRPPAADLKAVMAWIENGLDAAETARRKADGRVVLRRLNRTEYQNTIRDLLDVDLDLKERLPEDSAAHGFDNVGEALSISSVLMERYLEAADAALEAAIATEPRPKHLNGKFHYREESQVSRRLGGDMIAKGDAVVMFNSGYCPSTLRRLRISDRGRYRFRIPGHAHQSGGKPVTMAVHAGGLNSRGGKTWLVGHFDVPPGKPRVVEFVAMLNPRETIKVVPFNLGQRTIKKGQKYDGPGLAVGPIQVEGPLLEAWPPESHQRLLGGIDVEKSTLSDAKRILRTFAAKAFRRPVNDAELGLYLDLVKARLDGGFIPALKVGLTAVLCAPDFLFLREKPGKLDGAAIASRLSYFLWSSMPDDELARLARGGTLHRPDVLRKQVERMLADPKARAFTENFVGQWLELREIDFTTPDRKLYPEYDELLKVSMVRETELFFDEILKNDLSVLTFVDSDFSMLNGRLARHYSIKGVKGQEFRKVMLPPGSRRGGVLTHASVLKVTANGTFTSPVLRGVWVLERILGTPPDPPPPNVPAIEPDTRGATTVHEQLAKHRSVPACAACHATIDPPGFALENFDVIGGWREYYRSLGQGDRVETQIHGRRVRYRKGPDVEAGSVMADGKKFGDIDEFKRLLLRDKEQIVRCMAEKLMVYATGGAVGRSERREIGEIVKRVRGKNHGLRSLLHEVVRSRAFLYK